MVLVADLRPGAPAMQAAAARGAAAPVPAKRYADARFATVIGEVRDATVEHDTWPQSGDPRTTVRLVVETKPLGIRVAQSEYIPFTEAKWTEYGLGPAQNEALAALKGKRCAVTCAYTSNRDPMRSPYVSGIAIEWEGEA